MAGTDFGLPTGLLNASSPATTSTHSTPTLPVLPAPSFANFRFQSIGQQPGLLKRFSEHSSNKGHVEDENMSVSSDTEPSYQSIGQTALPRTRPSLLQALGESNGPFSADPPINNSLIGSSSTTPSFQFSVANVSDRPFGVSKGKAAQDITSSSSTFLSSSVASNLDTRISMLASSATGRPFDDSLASMQLSYPTASPGPSGSTDHPMTDVQPTRTPDRPSMPPVSRKYEGLRQMQARLQASMLNLNPPNLASAMLLAESAQQRATTLLAEARRNHNASQETLQAAQKSVTASLAMLEAADAVKGLADGAKAEIERVSSRDANQQRASDLNEIRELLQSMDSWISDHEAEDTALRAKRAQQLKLRKQKAELARASAQPPTSSPLSASPATYEPGRPTLTAAPVPVPAPAHGNLPLFFAATPEVDVKVNPQSRSPSLPQLEPDLSQRQADLREKLKRKLHSHSSAEAESRAGSPSEATRVEQQRLEEEKRRQVEEARRQEEEKRRQIEEARKQEEERKREEQRQKELLERQEAERRMREEEEKKAREKARREKEEAERKVREKAEAERKAREAMEAEKARIAEVLQKAQEEARRKEIAKEAAEKRKKAQAEEEERKRREAEAENQRMADFFARQKQEEKKVAQNIEEERRRVAQQEQEKERRLLEEQNKMKAQREREEKLRQEQEILRQQIRDNKDRAMADRAQQILAQRGHRPRVSTDGVSEMSLDSSPVMSKLVLNSNPSPSSSNSPSLASNVSRAPASPLESHSSLPVNQPSSTQCPPQTQSVRATMNNAPTNTRNSNTSGSQSAARNGQASMLPPVLPLRPVTPPVREVSLPPVAHFSPNDTSPPPPPPPPPQATWSIYRQSSDGGNVPYKPRESLNLSPQAQVANIRHVVEALARRPPPPNLVPDAVNLIKTEPLQDESTLLYPPESSDNEKTPQLSPSQSQPTEYVHGQPTAPQPTALAAPVTQQVLAPIPPIASQPARSLPSKPTHGSQTNTILDRCIPSSSPSVTDVAAPRVRPQQQLIKLDPAQLPQSQSQVSDRPMSSSNSQSNMNNRPKSRNEPTRQLAPPPTNVRSRSTSPFRMGPDTYIPSAAEVAPDHDNRAPPPSTYRGRPEHTNSALAHWDHYSPPPQSPRSPPRSANVYRPNYLCRSRSPTIAGRKRMRDSDSPPPYVNDYRDYDRRRSPRRYSRSPPPRRGRPASRSPSPAGYSNRVPLASRLTQGPGDNSYRPPSPPPRDPSTYSRPELLSRFTDTRGSAGLPTRPGRGRGKRGRGPSGGGPSHAHVSLEQRISSGTALMNRLEDPPTRS
ncbi:hypothetical protein P691DRAFT_163440 [Macrolepiota fuliginosa MF-IS2]|uniref:Uncharacterized protein n=1 Tax=Macrolepiota fuliginosa MF-IS2 TaxID=1400762 RepID=A0A9P6C8A8_9AGAR|nr:hypothetical protein P691DRAFT_163440 [Macrolepiota fuliginosa MF-IS2]